MLEIENFKIDQGRVFIIAELSCNHVGDLEIAKKTIREIGSTGVDAVKLQTESRETVTIDSDNDDFIIKGGTQWDGKSLWDLYGQTYTPYEWHQELKELTESLGMIFFSTPGGLGFDDVIDPVDFLEELNVPCYKIASFEITDIPLIKKVASKGKPVIMSTGVADYDDIKLAVDTCKNEGNEQIILLKCTSAYPTPLEDVNLQAMVKIGEDFDCPVGVSDHTLSNEVAISSVALGGCVIEKHVILDRNMESLDSEFSINIDELKQLVESVRKTEKLIGKATYELTDKQVKSKCFARSLYVVKDIKKGELFSLDNVRSIRPGYGMHPRHLINILGKKASSDISFAEPLSKELVEGFNE